MPPISSGAVATDGQFAVEVEKVMRRIRASLTDLFSALPDGVRKSRDVQRYLGIDSNLSWQLYKVLSTMDAIGAARFVPGPQSVRRVMECARDRGLDAAHITAAENAIEAYERLVHQTAGDRASFGSMLAGVVGGDVSEAIRKSDLQNRKAAFKAHSYYWGMQVETRLLTSIVAPSRTTPDRYDYANLRALIGLRRLRAEANMLVDRYSLIKGGEKVRDIAPEPMDPSTFRQCGANLVGEFSSKPLPAFSTTHDVSGEWRTELLSESVGQKSRVDLTFGHFMRGAPISPNVYGPGRMLGSTSRTWLPTKLLVMNVLIPRDLVPRDTIRPMLKVQGHALQARPGDLTDGHGVLPFSETVAYLGTGEAAAHSLDIPRYPKILNYVCKIGGWSLASFDLYRVRIEYPLLDTTVKAILEFDD